MAGVGDLQSDREDARPRGAGSNETALRANRRAEPVPNRDPPEVPLQASGSPGRGSHARSPSALLERQVAHDPKVRLRLLAFQACRAGPVRQLSDVCLSGPGTTPARSTLTRPRQSRRDREDRSRQDSWIDESPRRCHDQQTADDRDGPAASCPSQHIDPGADENQQAQGGPAIPLCKPPGPAETRREPNNGDRRKNCSDQPNRLPACPNVHQQLPRPKDQARRSLAAAYCLPAW